VYQYCIAAYDLYACTRVCVSVLKFQSKYLLACTQLAVKALGDDKHKPTRDEPCSDHLSICDSVERLYADWPQMHLV